MAKIAVTEYFCGCPLCGANDGCLTIPGQNWFRCDAHKLKWSPGLIRGWKNMEERELQENFERLEAYSDVSEEALPEGIWSTDLEIRKGEIEQYRRDIWVGPANAIVLHDWTHHPGEEPPF